MAYYTLDNATHTSASLHRQGCFSLQPQVLGKAEKLDARFLGGRDCEYDTGSPPFFAHATGGKRVQHNLVAF